MSQPLPDSSPSDGVVEAMLLQGVTPAQMRGITTEELEAVYALAYDALQAGRLDEAFDHAALLVSNDPWDRRFHLAMAICLQQAGLHEAAGRSYAHALAFDATDALATYRIGECLEAMGDVEAAREAYESAVKLSWLDEAYAAVREVAAQRLDGLNGFDG